MLNPVLGKNICSQESLQLKLISCFFKLSGHVYFTRAMNLMRKCKVWIEIVFIVEDIPRKLPDKC